MKMFGKYLYLVISPTKISAEKLKALSEGRSHIHADPKRKAVSKQEAADAKN